MVLNVASNPAKLKEEGPALNGPLRAFAWTLYCDIECRSALMGKAHRWPPGCSRVVAVMEFPVISTEQGIYYYFLASIAEVFDN